MDTGSHAIPPQERCMTVTVNGERRSVPEGCTVSELVQRLGLGGRACAVEVDRAIVPRKDHTDRRLTSGAQVEIVTLVGGG
jgi:sulfur carrier protein